MSHIEPEPRLRAADLRLGYGAAVVIDRLNLGFPDGQVSAIVGPNGCGKSTLLAGLARLRQPSGGAVLLDGRELARQAPREIARRLALLPQEAVAPEGLTVRDLIRFGRQPHQGLLRQWSPEDQAAVERALASAGLAGLAERPLETLSGGQRRRAWIAMAIAQETPLLLLDEPTAALDLGHEIEVFELIRELAAAGKTVVMVVHNLALACRYADFVVAMRGGAIAAQGAPAAVVTPALVRELYGVECQLIPDPLTGTPLVVGVRRAAARLQSE